ncbi:MAG: DNA-processing protein DprA [Aristaeellaceae bacterium]
MRYTRLDGCRAWLMYACFQPEPLTAMLRTFGDAQAIYDRFIREGTVLLEPYATPQQLDILRRQAEPQAMHQMMLTMHKDSIGVMGTEDFAYPDSLRDISAPPPLLMYRGDPDCLMGKCVTMVGSRNASPNAIAATEQIARELSEQGVTIVSGLAMGVDTAAHKGCLAGGSPTVGVMGCGLDVDYPAQNRQLKEDILRGGGLLLSEYPLGMPALPHHFPVRNRLLAGLSKAVVLMEARIRSGSMTTVQHALNQGREVFAYPGNIGSAWAEGTHQLLREGANYFTTAGDVLEDLGWDSAPSAPSQEQKRELPPMTAQQRLICTQLSQGEQSFDQLAEATGLDAPELSSSLTMLQILGLVRSLPGKMYVRIS